MDNASGTPPSGHTFSLQVRTMKVPPYHSAKPSIREVYHDHRECTEGNNIESYYLRQGTGGRPLCDHCKKLG